MLCLAITVKLVLLLLQSTVNISLLRKGNAFQTVEVELRYGTTSLHKNQRMEEGTALILSEKTGLKL